MDNQAGETNHNKIGIIDESMQEKPTISIKVIK